MRLLVLNTASSGGEGGGGCGGGGDEVDGEELVDALRMYILNLKAGGKGRRGRGEEEGGAGRAGGVGGGWEREGVRAGGVGGDRENVPLVRVQPNLQRFPKPFAIVYTATDVNECSLLLLKAEERVAALLAMHQCASKGRNFALSPEGTAYIHMSLWGGGFHTKLKTLLLALLAQQIPICLFSKVGEYVHDFVAQVCVPFRACVRRSLIQHCLLKTCVDMPLHRHYLALISPISWPLPQPRQGAGAER
jgi:hypothetical protein